MSAVPVEDKPSGPRSRKGTQTRARLLEAAKAVFEQDGFLEARITDIAERAGLSHGSFYHYFDSKEQIFREVAEAVEEELNAPLKEVVFAPEATAVPAERIREGNRSFLQRYRDEARIIGVIEQVSRYDEHVLRVRFEHQKPYTEQVGESIREMQRRGLCDPTLDPQTAAIALGGMVTRFAEMWLVQGLLDCDFDAAVDQLTRLFVNALQLKDPVRPSARRQPS